MAKDKSNYEARTFRLPPETIERMDRYSNESGVSKTAMVEMALRAYLDKVFPNTEISTCKK